MSDDRTADARVHAWHIDPRQYARQEQRRGRRHAFDRIDPARIALVVVDMIPFFVDTNPFCRGIVPNIALLAHCRRSAGGVVAWVLPAVATEVAEVRQEFFGPDIAAMFNASAGSGALPDRLWHEFGIHADDLVLENPRRATRARSAIA